MEISTLTTSGLGNYDASKADGSAYPSGTVHNTWKTYPMAIDRGVKFSLDRTDPNDTNFIATAENVIREFARNALVKEQDMYRIHQLYALAAAAGTYHDITFGCCISINGMVYENVMMLDDLPCFFVPQGRMKIVFAAQDGGPLPGEVTKDIAALVTHCETLLAVSCRIHPGRDGGAGGPRPLAAAGRPYAGTSSAP